MFGTSLEREFQLAATHFALSRSQIARLCADAMRTSFLPENQKDKLLAELRRYGTE